MRTHATARDPQRRRTPAHKFAGGVILLGMTFAPLNLTAKEQVIAEAAPSPPDAPVNDAPVNDTPVNDTPANDTPANVAAASDMALTEAALNEAANALEQGRTTTAVLRLEQLADAGVVHPDVSFTRGVAYLRRAESEEPQPGDFGQAAAAFRETLLLTPNDEFAARGLEEARIKSARRAAKGDEQVIETVSLARRLLLSLNPWVLFVLVAAGSLTTTAGLLFRALGTGTARTGGAIAGALGVCLLVLSVPLAVGSAYLRDSTRLAVVVAPRAPLLDEAGRALKGVSPLPEGTEVHFELERGQLLRLSSGMTESWLRRNQVRILQRPR